MLNKTLATLLFFSLGLAAPSSWARDFGASICNSAPYSCLKIKGHDSWSSLFPDEHTQMIVKKINRMNIAVRPGMTIAVPKDMHASDLMEFAPFPQQIAPASNNSIQVNLAKLAWGAYNEEGKLVNWGPVSGGKGYCPDIHGRCNTPNGSFTFFDKQGPDCKSHVFPIPHGGAPMPYCMHFHGGYALHGSPTVPGFNASHGCVRLFTEDAEWLNHEFVELGETRVHISH